MNIKKEIRWFLQRAYITMERLKRTKLWMAGSFILGYITHILISSQINHSVSTFKDNSNFLIPDTHVVLVILIFSTVNNFNRRQTIRDTWASNIKFNSDIEYLFVISGANLNEEQEIRINDEAITFKDLLVFKNLEDSFYLLTPKLLVSFGWLSNIDNVLGMEGQSMTQKTFKSYDFMLKCDDDSFVRSDRILRELKANFSGNRGENLYWGFFDGRARVKKAGKYKEESWNICDNYIPYALGGGYVLAEKLVQFMAKNGNYLKQYKSEDTSVGAWLSSYKDLNRLHDPRFDTEYISRGCHQTYLVTHKHSETAFKNFHKNILASNLLCVKEFRTRISYIYDWNVPPSRCCARNNPNVP